MIIHKPVSLADQVFEQLESDILTGKYQRGEILTEMKLCEELGVSRTPVREALRRLEQEHIIEECGKGMLVLSITAEDAENISETELKNAKAYLETPEVFAWTVTVVLLSVLLERVLLWLLGRKK